MSQISTDPDDENPHTAQESSITDRFPSIPGNPEMPSQHLSTSEPTQPLQKSRRTMKTLVLVAMVIILIAASFGAIYAVGQSVKKRADSSATAVVSTGTAQAHAIATAHTYATATAYASLNPYPNFKTIAVNDTLTANSGSHWYVGGEENKAYNFHGKCSFTENAYDVTADLAIDKTRRLALSTVCPTINSNLADFVFQVQIRIVRGDCGGLFFHSNNRFNQFYSLVICQTGAYELNIDNVKAPARLAHGKSTTLKYGLQQTNTIAIAVHDDIFDFYVNKHYVASVRNSTYQEGKIGVLAVSFKKVTEVMYNNAQVWIP